MKMRKYRLIVTSSEPYDYELMSLGRAVERLGCTPREFQRIADLAVREKFTARDKAFSVLRTA